MTLQADMTLHTNARVLEDKEVVQKIFQGGMEVGVEIYAKESKRILRAGAVKTASLTAHHTAAAKVRRKHPLWNPSGPPLNLLATPSRPPLEPLWSPFGAPMEPFWSPF